jgi:predicted amidohydrolase
LKCLVVYGYNEKCGDLYHNSICLLSENGEILVNYRKHLLFPVEHVWATPGPGFYFNEIKFWRINKTVRVGYAICMDLWHLDSNPYEEMPFGKFMRDN